MSADTNLDSILAIHMDTSSLRPPLTLRGRKHCDLDLMASPAARTASDGLQNDIIANIKQTWIQERDYACVVPDVLSLREVLRAILTSLYLEH